MSSYDKLRPWNDIERCECEKFTSIVLVDILTDNPIHCFRCKKEIDPEALKLDNKLVDDIASWYGVFRSLYNLWLNSGEYEQYAKDKLTDKHSQVNIEGISVAKRLSSFCPSYYWWFHDTDDGEPSHCPNCSKKLDPKVNFGTGKCEACNVVV
jgi:predicted  nucleic acid-binding Zn ribbon protein